MKTVLKVLVAIVALGLTISAAYFSVLGLTKMYAGAVLGTAIVCSFAEASKLIIASVLHQFNDKLNWLLKGILGIFLIGVMTITSIGVYGYLTSAFQSTADQLEIMDKRTNVIEMKRDRFQEQLDGYTAEKKQLAESITELSKGLSNNVIQYKDKETGEIITTTSSSTRKALQGQLNDFKEQRDKVSLKVEALVDSVTRFDLQIIDVQSNDELAQEIGPLKFIVSVSGWSMNKVVNVLTLILVILIDPLAIILVIVFNKINDKDEHTYTPEMHVEMMDKQTEAMEWEPVKEDDEDVNETEHLTSTEANVENLEESIEQLESDETVSVELTPQEKNWRNTLKEKLSGKPKPTIKVTDLPIEKQPHSEGKPIHPQTQDDFYGEHKSNRPKRIG